MQSLPALPDSLAIIAPVLAAILSGWLGQAHFKAWLNAVIAGAVIILLAVVSVIIGARFTGNVIFDAVLIATYAVAWMYGPLRVIQKYLILGPASQMPAVRHSPASVAISLKRIGGTSPLPQEEEKEIPPSE